MAPLLNVQNSLVSLTAVHFVIVFFFFETGGALLRGELQRVTQLGSQIALSPNLEHTLERLVRPIRSNNHNITIYYQKQKHLHY